MKNGLYSIHFAMLDGPPTRGAGVIVLREGTMLGGNGSLSYSGSYSVEGNKWKGELVTSPHTRNPGPRTMFEDREGSIGFSGSFDGEAAEARGTALLGKNSLTFRVTLRKLADA